MANNNDEVLGNEYIGASNTGGTATAFRGFISKAPRP